MIDKIKPLCEVHALRVMDKKTYLFVELLFLTIPSNIIVFWFYRFGNLGFYLIVDGVITAVVIVLLVALGLSILTHSSHSQESLIKRRRKNLILMGCLWILISAAQIKFGYSLVSLGID